MKTYFFDRSANFAKVAQQLSHLSLVEVRQVHGDKIWIIDNHLPTSSKDGRMISNTGQYDAIICNQSGVGLVIRTADCLPILIAGQSEDGRQVTAAVHAGRAGTNLGILEKVLAKLRDEFALTRGVEVEFGPAICVECYQVDRQTDQHFNLIKENTKQLKAIFSEEQATLKIHPDCTLCKKEQYCSYRNEGPGVKNNYSLIINEAN